MTTILTLAAIAVSLAGLVYLAGTDAKRRRAFNLPSRSCRFAWLAWIFVFAPGVALLAAAQAAAFVMWLGVVTIAGWLVAARAPTSDATSKPQ